MRRFFLLLLVTTSLNSYAEENVDETKYSIGVGIGSIYSGLGANIAIVSKTDMKYFSTGCVSYSSIYGASCGVGAGWISTSLLDSESNKHGFGIYASVAGQEKYIAYVDNSSGGQAIRKKDNIYGLGINYTYFLNGIDQSGATFGISIHGTNSKFNDNRIGGFLQVGYQF